MIFANFCEGSEERAHRNNFVTCRTKGSTRKRENLETVEKSRRRATAGYGPN